MSVRADTDTHTQHSTCVRNACSMAAVVWCAAAVDHPLRYRQLLPTTHSTQYLFSTATHGSLYYTLLHKEDRISKSHQPNPCKMVLRCALAGRREGAKGRMFLRCALVVHSLVATFAFQPLAPPRAPCSLRGALIDASSGPVLLLRPLRPPPHAVRHEHASVPDPCVTPSPLTIIDSLRACCFAPRVCAHKQDATIQCISTRKSTTRTHMSLAPFIERAVVPLIEPVLVGTAGFSFMSMITFVFSIIMLPFRAYRDCMGACARLFVWSVAKPAWITLCGA
jgi:hypothetical protein